MLRLYPIGYYRRSRSRGNELRGLTYVKPLLFCYRFVIAFGVWYCYIVMGVISMQQDIDPDDELFWELLEELRY